MESTIFKEKILMVTAGIGSFGEGIGIDEKSLKVVELLQKKI